MADLSGIRIGVIGAGALGGALIDRLLAAGGVRPDDIVACESREARRQEIAARFRVRVSANPEDAAACAIIALTAPPLEIAKILKVIAPRLEHRPLVISCAGAIPLELLEAALPAGIPLMRVNPNSPLLVGAGYNPIVHSARMTGQDRELASGFLALLGDSPLVPDAEMNLYTALTAVGPTYFLPVFDAMIQAGIDGGLSREAAVAAAVATARGTAEMIARRAEGAEPLKLYTGLRPLDHAAMRDFVAKAIAEALARMEAVQRQAGS
jgi:pyrroline-5-carboxylate reductase